MDELSFQLSAYFPESTRASHASEDSWRELFRLRLRLRDCTEKQQEEE